MPLEQAMRTFVYVDGFNLYYRMLKARPSMKWLNPKALSEAVLSTAHRVERVNYYTARVSSRAHDPDAPARQAIYFGALGTVPEIVLHEGNFLTKPVWMPLAQPPMAKPDGYVWAMPAPEVVQVMKSEEKGSDVNLGSHLVRDAFTNAFDTAVVITNDSDLTEPIRIAVQEAGKRVGILVPVKNPTASLIAVASFHLHIRPGHLAKAQFPDPVNLPDGSTIERPASWV
jgi:uncharacterized LabA/DUF88 family protein